MLLLVLLLAPAAAAVEAHVVVCVCHENVDWIHDALIRYFPYETYRVYLYSKCDADLMAFIQDKPAYSVYRLPNVGFEAHAYLHHIVEHYDALPEHLYFFQGDAGKLDLPVLTAFDNNSTYYTYPNLAKLLAVHHFHAFGILCSGLNDLTTGCPSHCSLGFRVCALLAVFGQTCRLPSNMVAGAYFAVVRNRIVQYPKHTYSAAYAILNGSIWPFGLEQTLYGSYLESIGKAEACAMERVWNILFSYHRIDPRCRNHISTERMTIDVSRSLYDYENQL